MLGWPDVQQLRDGVGAGAAVAAVGDLGAQLGLQALSFALALDLPGDLALATGDGSIPGHRRSPDSHRGGTGSSRLLSWSMRNSGESLTASLTQSKQKPTAQAT